ncbi:MAG: hypothetical protein CBD98_004130 [Flavobacteriaceae bacterium TMED238]|nr:hypothetical protein [Flavobacteriales bacterium]RPG61092.1 MAG: hypothetical protein CBD98_004130 [Flavobacteriaceae bacterium TMED238]
MRYLILLFCFLNCFTNLSQETTIRNNSTTGGFFNKVKDSMSIENFEFDVNKLKYFGISNDTILIDTSLTIKKYYQFNYRKKDNFELLEFNNVGQVYNKLSFKPNKNIFSKIGYTANELLLINKNDYKFYDVAYPLTELFFKSVFSQGQLTDALFTSNINRNTNFLLAFKALRSLGKYQSGLSGSKHFRFGFSFVNENLDSKLFFISQKLEKQENGGLNDTSLDDFISGNDEFKERSKLNVNFEDTQNIFQTRNLYFNNKLLIVNKNENQVFLSYNLDYETTNNTYKQDQASFLYGSIDPNINEINEHFKFRSLKNKFSIFTKTKFFDELNFGYINYNYNFFKVEEILEKLTGENSNIIHAEMLKTFDNTNIYFKIHQKINGERVGNNFDLAINSHDKNKFNYKLNFNIIQSHPGMIYDIYQSDYNEISFDTSHKLSETKSLRIKFDFEKFGNIDLNYSNIKNHFYLTVDDSQQNKFRPFINQHDGNINFLKIRYDREFKFGIFRLDNSIIYQSVNQNKQIINLPKLLIRNTLYISEKVFKNVLDLQTGFSLKTFSKFYADDYNPLLSTFHIQTSNKIGGYPILDFFVNAKIRQTRIFLIAEHVNSSLSEGKFLSSPTSPYRDSNIRFGFRWNLFN